MTLDLDFAHAGKNLSIAMQSDVRVDTRGALESLQMGFIPVVSQTTYKVGPAKFTATSNPAIHSGFCAPAWP